MLRKAYLSYFIFWMILIMGCGYTYKEFPTNEYKEGDTLSFVVRWMTYPSMPSRYDIAEDGELVAVAETKEHFFIRVLISKSLLDTKLKNFPWDTLDVDRHIFVEYVGINDYNIPYVKLIRVE